MHDCHIVSVQGCKLSLFRCSCQLCGCSHDIIIGRARELPDKWVDTRAVPRMTLKEAEFEREDPGLLNRRRYFLYVNDRMRDLSYNLLEDCIMHLGKESDVCQVTRDGELKVDRNVIEVEREEIHGLRMWQEEHIEDYKVACCFVVVDSLLIVVVCIMCC